MSRRSWTSYWTSPLIKMLFLSKKTWGIKKTKQRNSNRILLFQGSTLLKFLIWFLNKITAFSVSFLYLLANCRHFIRYWPTCWASYFLPVGGLCIFKVIYYFTLVLLQNCETMRLPCCWSDKCTREHFTFWCEARWCNNDYSWYSLFLVKQNHSQFIP